jgi:hypothetical protein
LHLHDDDHTLLHLDISTLSEARPNVSETNVDGVAVGFADAVPHIVHAPRFEDR